jgi:hypothetical protein
MNELPLSSQTRINLLRSNHRGRLFTSSTPHQVTQRKARYTVLPENVSHEEGFFTSAANLSTGALAEYPRQRAIITLQNWYRSISMTNRAVAYLQSHQETITVRERKILAVVRRSPVVKQILRVLSWSLLISRTQLKENITAIIHRQVTSLLDEIISTAFDFGYSRHVYAEIETQQRAAMEHSDSQSSNCPLQSSAYFPQSFAQKMMKKGVKKFNKMTKSIYGTSGEGTVTHNHDAISL